MTFAFGIQKCLVNIMTSSVLSEAVYDSFSFLCFFFHFTYDILYVSMPFSHIRQFFFEGILLALYRPINPQKFDHDAGPQK